MSTKRLNKFSKPFYFNSFIYKQKYLHKISILKKILTNSPNIHPSIVKYMCMYVHKNVVHTHVYIIKIIVICSLKHSGVHWSVTKMLHFTLDYMFSYNFFSYFFSSTSNPHFVLPNLKNWKKRPVAIAVFYIKQKLKINWHSHHTYYKR